MFDHFTTLCMKGLNYKLPVWFIKSILHHTDQEKHLAELVDIEKKHYWKTQHLICLDIDILEAYFAPVASNPLKHIIWSRGQKHTCLSKQSK